MVMAGAFITLAIPFLIMKFGAQHIEQAQSFCPFKMATGLPCPGCGITKSFIFFYEGDWYNSFHYHLFGPFAVVFCVFILFLIPLEFFTQKQYLRNVLYNKTLAYFLSILLIVYHLYRTIDFIHSNSLQEIIHQSIWG
jgi:hypothetical protein